MSRSAEFYASERRIDIQAWKRALAYCPHTGAFRWSIDRQHRGYRKSAGDTVGVFKNGYIAIHFMGETVLAHRLAFFFSSGRSPVAHIDHVNGVGSDNRAENLREATQAQNCWNARKHCDNSSGVKGVVFDKKMKKWNARIMKRGVRFDLGFFDDRAAAGAAYAKAARSLFGSFARPE